MSVVLGLCVCVRARARARVSVCVRARVYSGTVLCVHELRQVSTCVYQEEVRASVCMCVCITDLISEACTEDSKSERGVTVVVCVRESEGGSEGGGA